MEKTENILEVKNLNVKLNNHQILSDISFNVKRDDTVAIIGPNGAGKTMLFKCLLGLIPYSGQIKWAPDIKIGYVPQKIYIAKDVPLTVGEFLSIKEKNPKKVEEVLVQVGFGKEGIHKKHNGERLMNSKLGVLSGGEFQRVLIANAVLGDPQVLLFDEPTSGVDISAEETVYSLIENLKKDVDLTIIFISHELQVVYKYATTVLCLNKENVCFGLPREVIDKQSLQKLYGEDVHFHHHDHF